MFFLQDRKQPYQQSDCTDVYPGAVNVLSAAFFFYADYSEKTTRLEKRKTATTCRLMWQSEDTQTWSLSHSIQPSGDIYCSFCF